MIRFGSSARARTVCAVIGIACLAGGAHAAPITFIHTSHGSGTIGGVPFGDAPFTITATADTANRQSFSGAYYINHVTASIDIVGVGVYTFITATRTFVFNAGNAAGFSRSGPIGADLVTSGGDPSLGTWDMLSSIGPVPGPGELLQWGSSPTINTSGGTLFFNPDENPGGTFQAIVVPGPASIGALGFTGLVITRRRRTSAIA